MKKIYATLTRNDVKCIRFFYPFSMMRGISFLAMIAFLLNDSSVFASNLAITGQKIMSDNSPGVAYPRGSHGSIVLSGDDDFCGVDNVIGRGDTIISHGQERKAKQITAEEQYQRFIENKAFGGFHPYGSNDGALDRWSGDGRTASNNGYMGMDTTRGDTNILPVAHGIYSFATGCGSSARGNYSVAFGANATARSGGAQAFGVSALASGKVSVAVGVGSEASGDAALAFGGLSVASGQHSVAIGQRAVAQSSGAIAIGSSDSSENKTMAYGQEAIAIGTNAIARVSGGIAVGSRSVSNTDHSVLGYDPVKNGRTTDSGIEWKSTAGAFSVGFVEGKVTRQITGVAAGTEDTDAVNVAQLKKLRGAIGNWKLTVNGEDSEGIGLDDVVDFSTGSTNLTVTKGKDGNKIKFDLARGIIIDSLKVGNNVLDAAGLIISGGPKITTGGIDAGKKKVTNVKFGDIFMGSMDAITGSQLYSLGDNVAASLGGGSYKDGKWSAPTFKFKIFDTNGEEKDGTYENVAEALTGVGASITNINNKFTEQINNAIANVRSDSLVKWNEETKLIKLGEEKEGTKITVANKDNESRIISGIKEGIEDTDAVNVAQLKAVQKAATIKGLKVNTIGKDFKDAIADGQSSIAIGNSASVGVGAINAIAIGYKAKVSSHVPDAISIGSYTAASRNGAIAIGAYSSVNADGAIAFGYGTKADVVGMVVIGSNAGPKGEDSSLDTSYSVAVGFQAKVAVRDSIVLGYGSLANVGAGVIGYDPSMKANSDKQDSIWESSLGALSIGDSEKGITRQIVGVSAGTNDTDAVNVAQVKSLQ
ncbi:hypothetical protein MCY_01300, partial [Bartonella rattimassiliensis 15908]